MQTQNALLIDVETKRRTNRCRQNAELIDVDTKRRTNRCRHKTQN